MSSPADPALPNAQPPLDPGLEPFVGNSTVDENLGEAVRVALWSALGEASRHLQVEVVDGRVTLSGIYAGRRERSAAHAALRALPGLRTLRDLSVTAAGAVSATAPDAAPARPFLHVTRFCGVDEASTGAAIRQAVEAIDRFCAAHEVAPPEELIVHYRNPLPGAITLEIGCAAPPQLATHAHGDLQLSTLPAGLPRRLVPAPGLAGVHAGVLQLLGEGALAVWQRFGPGTFRPWHGHLEADLEAVLPPALPTPRARQPRKSRAKPA